MYGLTVQCCCQWEGLYHRMLPLLLNFVQKTLSFCKFERNWIWTCNLHHTQQVSSSSINFIVMCFSYVLGSRRTTTSHCVRVKLREPVGRQGSDSPHDRPHLCFWYKMAAFRRMSVALCWHESFVLTTVIILMSSLCHLSVTLYTGVAKHN